MLGNAGVASLDLSVILDEVEICRNIGVRGQIHVDVTSPGQHDVQIQVGNGQGITYDVVSAADSVLVQERQFLLNDGVLEGSGVLVVGGVE